MVPDERLITLARQGNQSAAENLFRRYYERIFSYLVRMIGDRDLAEDAAQEAFIRGFRSLKTYRNHGSFKSWIFRIAHREGLRMLKRERRHSMAAPLPKDDVYQDIADSAPLPEDIVVHHEQLQRLETALERLNDAERQVVLLRMSEGLPFKEIAGITGTPLNTVLGRMRNAVKKLRRELNQENAADERG